VKRTQATSRGGPKAELGRYRGEFEVGKIVWALFGILDNLYDDCGIIQRVPVVYVSPIEAEFPVWDWRK
jgi:hypothetical protein